ncbi:MAG: anti-sigma factor [Actinomycetota bacterium]
MAEMTHETCSELLRRYVRGKLPREDVDAVRAHLTGCAECRAEEQAVGALLATKPESLTDLERARLHRGLAQELFVTRANADIATPAPAAPWKRWIVPALGSAAAVLVALLVITGGPLGSDGGDEAETGALQEGADASRDAVRDATVEPFSAQGGGSAQGSEPVQSDNRPVAAAGEAGTAFDAAGPKPEFEVAAGELTPEELASIGRGSELFRSFSERYTVADVDALREDFLGRLVDRAGPASDQARRCAATLPQDESILPAYGATGEYDGEDALVLGFVTNDAGSPSLDRYLMWVWTKGSCSQPVDTLFERIER